MCTHGNIKKAHTAPRRNANKIMLAAYTLHCIIQRYIIYLLILVCEQFQFYSVVSGQNWYYEFIYGYALPVLYKILILHAHNDIIINVIQYKSSKLFLSLQYIKYIKKNFFLKHFFFTLDENIIIILLYCQYLQHYLIMDLYV